MSLCIINGQYPHSTRLQWSLGLSDDKEIFVTNAGSFFSFEKIEELMHYEQSLPHKYEDTITTVCSYHLKDFETLTETQQQILLDHHFKSMSVE
jgi:hypothetical protein